MHLMNNKENSHLLSLAFQILELFVAFFQSNVELVGGTGTSEKYNDNPSELYFLRNENDAKKSENVHQ